MVSLRAFLLLAYGLNWALLAPWLYLWKIYAGLPSLSAADQRSVYLVNVWVLAAIGCVSLILASRRPSNTQTL